jgi:hypothetical protein
MWRNKSLFFCVKGDNPSTRYDPACVRSQIYKTDTIRSGGVMIIVLALRASGSWFSLLSGQHEGSKGLRGPRAIPDSTVSVCSDQWVNGCYLRQMSNFQLYYGENKLYSMKWWRCLLCTTTNTLCRIFIVLAQWNNSPRVDMSLHSNTLFRFLPNQRLLK